MRTTLPLISYDIPVHPGVSEEELIRSKEIPEEKWNDLWNKGMLLAMKTDAWANGENNYVFGAGDVDTASILVIGEAPGEKERGNGIPFIGPAGITLSGALEKAGIHRTRDVFLANTVSLAPNGIGNEIGKPFPADMMIERERVLETFQRLKPSVVVLLGKYAVLQFMCEDMFKGLAESRRSLLESDIKIGSINGFYEEGVQPFFDCPVAVNYHPSYLLRMSRAAARTGASIHKDLQAYYEFWHRIKSQYLRPRIVGQEDNRCEKPST